MKTENNYMEGVKYIKSVIVKRVIENVEIK